MRFAVRSAPPFCYRTKLTDNSKGGTVSCTATLDHAFLPAVRRCKTEHLNDGRSNVCQTVLGGNAGSVLCIVLDSVLDFLIIDDERNGVERVGCSYLNLTLLVLFEHLVCVAVIGGYHECNTVLIANLDKS